MQISCLRAEQTQLTRSLEKERHKAAEHRQEYLALKEEADTKESRASQLEDELKELRKKHKEELHEALMHQDLLQQVPFFVVAHDLYFLDCSSYCFLFQIVLGNALSGLING